jgi:PAS domain S-box-containing protein
MSGLIEDGEKQSHALLDEHFFVRPVQILDVMPLAGYVCDRDGTIIHYNPKAVELWGRSPALHDPRQRFCGSLRLFHPDGSPLPHSACPMAVTLRTGMPVRDQKFVIEQPDGSRITALANIDACRDDTGKIVGAIGCLQVAAVNGARPTSDLTTATILDFEHHAEEQSKADGRREPVGDRKHARERGRFAEASLATELAAMQRLQDVSTLLIEEDNFDTLYEKILDTAATIMRSDMVSMQMLYRERGELGLLAWKGFHPDSAAFWQWVHLDSGSTCGAALSTGQRVVVPDVEACEFMAGTGDLEAYRRSNIRAVQSTPLISRTGTLLGMISTHWREPHRPLERDLRLLDVLARQAADLLERTKTVEALRESEARLRNIVEMLPAALYATDAEGRITMFNKAAVEFSGRVPEIGTDSWCVSWKLYWPDGTPLPHDECPMALALKEKRPITGMEAIAERPDGTRVPFMPYPSPIFDAAGRLVGAVNMLVDLTELKRGEESAARLAAVVEHSHVAIVSKDLNGIIASWNPEAEKLFGYTAEEAIGKSVTMLIPADRIAEEPAILERIRRGERVETYETVRQRKDGSLVDVSLTVSPVRDATTGRVIGASKIARDITERKRAQKQRELLLREMNHRVKNLFALVGGMVSLSRRGHDSADDLVSVLRGRLDALAHAHQLTLPQFSEQGRKADQATTLGALLQAIVAPYLDPDDGGERIVINGPDVPIGGHATNLALVLHELTTNAAKYGALSSPSGRVEIGWSAHNGELLLTWKEEGGPALHGAPESEGFGSLLARQTVTGQFGGSISHQWLAEGLMVQLAVPLDRLA